MCWRILPHEGIVLVEQGFRLEVADMDGRKMDKLLVVAVEA